MQFTIAQSLLLAPLQLIAAGVERRQTMPILANVLLEARDKQLKMVTSDLEVELMSWVKLDDGIKLEGETTISAKKFLDICKSLPPDAPLDITQSAHRFVIQSNKSRFTLTTLPGHQFPRLEGCTEQCVISLSESKFRKMLQQVHFSMGFEDVRHYLNGATLMIESEKLQLVAADGHRSSSIIIKDINVTGFSKKQIIIPYKTVKSLVRLLNDTDTTLYLMMSDNYISIKTDRFRLVSKLVDAKIPNYDAILPKMNNRELLSVNREELQQALSRVSILANEKYRGIRIEASQKQLRIFANNPEQESAEEEIRIEYAGEPLKTGFNVNYLLEICHAVPSETLHMAFTEKGGVLIEGANDKEENSLHYILPLRL
jgi:DNA polymerase-3 subunit beta